MAAPDWVAYGGLALSVALAVREVFKHRRATRPHLVVHVRTQSNGRFRPGLAPAAVRRSIPQGETCRFVVHNRGGVGTTIERSGLAVVVPRVPVAMVGILGTTIGRLPTIEAPHLTAHRAEGAAARGVDGDLLLPGAEVELRIVMWDEHRAAVESGRLLLVVAHSWSRGRPQQLRVRVDR